MRKWACLLVLGLLLPACGRPPPAPGESAPGATPGAAAAGSERLWQGVFPCQDCQGIDTRLLLRQDGERRSYQLAEIYLDGAREPEFDEAGTWTEVATAPAFVGRQSLLLLDSGRATRRFLLDADGSLELLDDRGQRLPDGASYRLQRR